MKVSIGMKLQSGPWGGGNQFAVSLSAYLQNKGIKVIHHLLDSDIDLILLTEPRKSSLSSAFTDAEVQDYLRFKNPQALVVHRINECDERKGTDYVNKLLIEANRVADHTVFIASWLEKLFMEQGMADKSRSVILNGADRSVFNPQGFTPWDGTEPLRIVTHHWGGNWLKGFDIYQRLDEMQEEPEWKGKIAFTYIGRTPDDFTFRNSRLIEPLSGKALARELQKHHLYITASRNEPAGMHHIEGAMSGMPLLYIESGSLPEYCGGFGVAFTPETFEEKLAEILATYSHWLGRMPAYDKSAERMCAEYLRLFSQLLQRKEELLAKRNPMPDSSFIDWGRFRLQELQKRFRRFRKSIGTRQAM